MAFGRKKASESSGTEPAQPLESYDVVYKGGLRSLPKAKVGKIKMEFFPDRIVLLPTSATKKFWTDLEIPYDTVTDLQIADRTVSTFEGLAGGLDSRQLNQKNNIHISYAGVDGDTLLRLEMLSGVTVMGQAKKCNELEDRLRYHGIRNQFATNAPPSAHAGGGLSDELSKLASLKDNGALTEEEFAAAKARLLG